MKKYIVLILFIYLAVGSSHAQLIDIFQGHMGTAIFPTDAQINFETGKPDNLYAGYFPAQVFGVGASKFITDKIQIILTTDFQNTFKKNYSIIFSKTYFGLKYSILAPDIYRIAPYLTGGGNFLFVRMSQSNFTLEYIPPAEYSGINKVKINEIEYRENNYNFTSPVFGAAGGIGVDINVYNNLSVFAEANYNYNFAKQSGMQNEFTTYNKAQFTYINMITGIRLYMY
ncbi:MAG: hypothetical protein NW207_12790 [Cytophagales bacterium]|nr:hypothetical protein [Cytophagales bacterium]